MENKNGRTALVIGAGIYGLVTAKTLLHDSETCFDCVVIFEKSAELGGVWSPSRTYKGLITNSPLLTYEIPGFLYPKELRKTGKHVPAEDVYSYLQAYAEQFGLVNNIKFNTTVEDVSWDASSSAWKVKSSSFGDTTITNFSHLVVCSGLYHASHMILEKTQISKFKGNVWHSSDVSDGKVQEALGTAQNVVVIGAGKSAIDIATILAQGRFSIQNGKSVDRAVTLVYRKPHWLSPRKILRNTIPFEKLLFSRFVNAWLPYVTPPDRVHTWIAKSSCGKWVTKLIVRFIEDDFVCSSGQGDLPQTIPKYSIVQALSGALHVPPLGYLECIRDGSIEILEGKVASLGENVVQVITNNGETKIVKADSIISGTGYNLALPFFSFQLLRDMGVVDDSVTGDLNNLSHVKLYRLIVPPRTIHQNASNSNAPYRNIAFNGFAYSLINPTVASITANWITDYFNNRIQFPPEAEIDQDIKDYRSWQTASFGRHGAKGVHIGPHGTLFSDQLLADMNLQTGHVANGIPGPLRFFRQWFRPMFPQLYAGVASERKHRDQKGE